MAAFCFCGPCCKGTQGEPERCQRLTRIAGDSVRHGCDTEMVRCSQTVRVSWRRLGAGSQGCGPARAYRAVSLILKRPVALGTAAVLRDVGCRRKVDVSYGPLFPDRPPIWVFLEQRSCCQRCYEHFERLLDLIGDMFEMRLEGPMGANCLLGQFLFARRRVASEVIS